MKFLFPNLSELFATWASASQYGCVAELDPTPNSEFRRTAEVDAGTQDSAHKTSTTSPRKLRKFG